MGEARAGTTADQWWAESCLDQHYQVAMIAPRLLFKPKPLDSTPKNDIVRSVDLIICSSRGSRTECIFLCFSWIPSLYLAY